MAKVAPGDAPGGAPGGAPASNLQADEDDSATMVKKLKNTRIMDKIKHTLDIYGDTTAPMDELKPVNPTMLVNRHCIRIAMPLQCRALHLISPSSIPSPPPPDQMICAGIRKIG